MRKHGDRYKPQKCRYCGNPEGWNKRLCNSCYTEKRRAREMDGYYWIYYLPKEKYIGMSNNPESRWRKHSSLGKYNTDGARKIIKFKNPKICVIVESILHLWFAGSQYQHAKKKK